MKGCPLDEACLRRGRSEKNQALASSGGGSRVTFVLYLSVHDEAQKVVLDRSIPQTPTAPARLVDRSTA